MPKSLINAAKFAFSFSINAISSFLLTRILTSNYSASSYGDYSYLFVISGILGFAVFEGFRTSVTQFTNGNPDAKIIREINIAYIIGFALILIGFSAFSVFYPHSNKPALFHLIPWAVAGQASLDYGLVRLRSLNKVGLFTIIYSGRSVVLLIIVYIIHKSSRNIDDVVVAIIVTQFVSLAISLYLIFRLRGEVLQHITVYKLTDLKRIMKFAIPIGLSALISYSTASYIKLFIMHKMGAESLGVFSSSFDTTFQIFIAMASIIQYSTINQTIKLYNSSTGVISRITRVNSVAVAAIIPIVIVLSIEPGAMTGLLLGEDYRVNANYLLQFLILGISLHVLRNYFFDSIFTIVEKSNLTMLINLCSFLLVYITINFIYDFTNISEVAILFSITQALILLMSLLLLKHKKVMLFRPKILIKTSFLSILATLSVFYMLEALNLNLLIHSFISIVLSYAASAIYLLLIEKTVNKEHE